MFKTLEIMEKVDVSPIEQYVIDKVRQMRTERGISKGN